jgi:hypothetical protein
MTLARIAIIGVGQVGAAAAYAIILQGLIASELLLVDVKIDLRDAQVRDLSDVAYSVGSGTRVRAATHHEAGQCDMVVITAGSKCSPGRLLLHGSGFERPEKGHGSRAYTPAMQGKRASKKHTATLRSSVAC